MFIYECCTIIYYATNFPTRAYQNTQNQAIDFQVCTERPADGVNNSELNYKFVQVCTQLYDISTTTNFTFSTSTNAGLLHTVMPITGATDIAAVYNSTAFYLQTVE